MFLDNACLKIVESLPSAKACSKNIWSCVQVWVWVGVQFCLFLFFFKHAKSDTFIFWSDFKKESYVFFVSFLFPTFSFGPKVLLFLNRITTEVRPWIRKRTEHEEVEFLCIFPKRIMYFYWDLKCTSWEIVIQTNLSRLFKF